jgi:ABC-2 type transport system permease protein
MITRARAFLARDFRVERTYRAAFAGQVLGILMFLATFAVVAPIVRTDFADRFGAGYFAYAAVGVAASGALLAALQAFSGALREAQLEGTLEAMLLAPAPHAQVISLLGVWPLVVSFIASGLTLGAAAAGGAHFSVQPVTLALAMLMSFAAFAGLGLLSAAAVLVAKRGDPIAVLFGMVGALTAGAYAPTSTFPGWLRVVAAVNPMTYGLRAWRGALLAGRGPATVAPDLAVLAVLALVAVPLARIAVRRAIDLARAEGTLGGY